MLVFQVQKFIAKEGADNLTAFSLLPNQVRSSKLAICYRLSVTELFLILLTLKNTYIAEDTVLFRFHDNEPN